jgi:hypothetical protein
MKNRYVIALNRIRISDKNNSSDTNKGAEDKLSEQEVSDLMNVVRKYPKRKSNLDNHMTCGFFKN